MFGVNPSDIPERRDVISTMIATESKLEGVSERYINLLKRTVAKKATNEELELFLYTASRYDLDPLMKEIIFWKDKKGTPVMVVTRDGYLKAAMRDPGFDGLTSFVVREGDVFKVDAKTYEVEHSFGVKRGKILGAWAVAYHKTRRPYICFVDYSEYRKRNNTAWDNYPSAMIQKVAEVFSLRRQFNISGLVAREEMGYEMYGDLLVPDKQEQIANSDVAKAIDAEWKARVDTDKEINVESDVVVETGVERPSDAEGSGKDAIIDQPVNEKEIDNKVEERPDKEPVMENPDAPDENKRDESATNETTVEESPDDDKEVKISSVEELKALLEKQNKDVTKQNLVALSRACLKSGLIKDVNVFLKIKEEIENL